MKLQKHISILLTALVLFANMGLALNVHYCHDEVTEVSLAYSVAEPHNYHHENHEAEGCCKAKAETHKKCCSDKVVKLKDSEVKNLVKSFQLELAAFYPVSIWNAGSPVNAKENTKSPDAPAFYCESNAPPLYKLYCRYILYA